MNDENPRIEEAVSAASEKVLIQKEKQAISSRPHWITILTGLLSPTIGVVALFVSLQSLKTSQLGVETSERAMKVGQRAYLTVSKGNFESYEYTLKRSKSDFVSVDVTFTINNLGNTPASIKKISFVYALPSGWSDVSAENDADSDNLPGDIGPKQQTEWATSHMATLTPSAIAQFRSQVLRLKRHVHFAFADKNGVGAIDAGEVLEVKATVDYLDVFNEHHSMKWCWVQNAMSPDNPLQCESLVPHEVPVQ